MDLSQILAPLVAQGPLGLLCAVSLYFAWSKDRDLKASNEARLAEGRESAKEILAVVDKVYKATEQLADTADKLVKLKRGDGT
jgi:hypothetical protein